MKIRSIVIALSAGVMASVPSCVVGQESNAMPSSDMDEILEVSDTQNRRKLFSFWGLLFMLAHPRDCPSYFTEEETIACKSYIHENCPPIGPKHHDCVAAYIADVNSASGYDSSSDGSSDGSSNVNGAAVADGTYSFEDGTGSGTSTSTVGEASQSKTFSWLMLVVAGVAATAAMVAAIIGQRRGSRDDRHPMTGVIKRRVNQFSCFADSAICASTERPDRVVEMTMSQDDMNYSLQKDDDGVV